MNMFSCPSPSVSRIGSIARTTGTARATANHGETACRRATGATVDQVTTTTTPTEASRTRISVDLSGSQVSGTSSAAAKGGYVNPFMPGASANEYKGSPCNHHSTAPR
jgi:hypothetical protein